MYAEIFYECYDQNYYNLTLIAVTLKNYNCDYLSLLIKYFYRKK